MRNGLPMLSGPRFTVALLGARAQYAVPRILQEAGWLERLYTDLCPPRGLRWLLSLTPAGLRGDGVKRLLGRVPGQVPGPKIRAATLLGLRYAYRRRRAHSDEDRLQAYLWAGRAFGDWVCRKGFGRATAVYAYNTAAVEVLRRARAQGLRTVLEQTIAPKAVEILLLRQEQERFPGWEDPPRAAAAVNEICRREEVEWALADVIACGSEFVREGVRACGGPAEKCQVLPYGADVPPGPAHAAAGDRRPGPLRVLTVGTLSLRKGTPYAYEAARRLGGACRFRLVGPSNLRPEALERLRRVADVVGPVPRGEIAAHYAWADAFLLPSVCEGSALASYEALAAGLPVLATANAGTLVEDGVSGYVLPRGDVDALVARLTELRDDPDCRRGLAQGAARRARAGNFAAYAARLRACLNPNAARASA
jgi:glycosyltransferase involved in cell wall biosynthesis